MKAKMVMRRIYTVRIFGYDLFHFRGLNLLRNVKPDPRWTIQYGHYDGKRYLAGTRLTSKENGEIIEASPDTPEDRIVCIVEPDK